MMNIFSHVNIVNVFFEKMNAYLSSSAHFLIELLNISNFFKSSLSATWVNN